MVSKQITNDGSSAAAGSAHKDWDDLRTHWVRLTCDDSIAVDYDDGYSNKYSDLLAR